MPLAEFWADVKTAAEAIGALLGVVSVIVGSVLYLLARQHRRTNTLQALVDSREKLQAAKFDTKGLDDEIRRHLTAFKADEEAEDLKTVGAKPKPNKWIVGTLLVLGIEELLRGLLAYRSSGFDAVVSLAFVNVFSNAAWLFNHFMSVRREQTTYDLFNQYVNSLGLLWFFLYSSDISSGKVAGDDVWEDSRMREWIGPFKLPTVFVSKALEFKNDFAKARLAKASAAEQRKPDASGGTKDAVAIKA